MVQDRFCFTVGIYCNLELLAFCNFWKLKPLYIYLQTAICFLKKDILVTFWNRYKKTKPAEKKLLRVVNVPERLSGKSFNFSKIARLFHADCKI